MSFKVCEIRASKEWNIPGGLNFSVEYNPSTSECRFSDRRKFNSWDDYAEPCEEDKEQWLYTEMR